MFHEKTSHTIRFIDHVGSIICEAATNNDYCIMPVFTNEAAKPNILIVMDFSGSMQFPAYLPNNFDNRVVTTAGQSQTANQITYPVRKILRTSMI